MIATCVNLYRYGTGKDYKCAMAIGLSFTALTLVAEYHMATNWVKAECKKLESLCYLDEEDLDAILNVFRISIINDEKLSEETSIMMRSYYSGFINNTALTNFIEGTGAVWN